MLFLVGISNGNTEDVVQFESASPLLDITTDVIAEPLQDHHSEGDLVPAFKEIVFSEALMKTAAAKYFTRNC